MPRRKAEAPRRTGVSDERRKARNQHCLRGSGVIMRVLYVISRRNTFTRIDRDALDWWEVLGTLKWGIICALQAATHLSGTIRSVELAAIGRRVCEVESDLLELLP